MIGKIYRFYSFYWHLEERTDMIARIIVERYFNKEWNGKVLDFQFNRPDLHLFALDEISIQRWDFNDEHIDILAKSASKRAWMYIRYDKREVPQ